MVPAILFGMGTALVPLVSAGGGSQTPRVLARLDAPLPKKLSRWARPKSLPIRAILKIRAVRPTRRRRRWRLC